MSATDRRVTPWVAVLTIAVAATGAPHASRRPVYAAQAVAAPSPACVLPEATSAWIQRALTGWAAVRRDALALPGTARPWMVFYDPHCEFHLDQDARSVPGATRLTTPLRFGGAPVAVRARRHDGRVWLPDGSFVSAAENVARATMLNERAAYFVVATPEMWRRVPAFAEDANLDAFFLGVTIHELAHTEQLPYVLPRLRAVARAAGLTQLALDDDVIQDTFGDRPGFREAIDAERDTLYEAVGAADAQTRRTLLGRALALAEARRTRFFTGDAQHYRRLEDEFLSLEGAGQWAAYRFALLDRPTRTAADAIAFVRDTRKYWSQELGLALFLLLDLEVPGWQSRVFGPDDPGPFGLLAESMARR